MYFNKEIIQSISKELNLPYTGIEQDWDIEMANYKRIREFLCYFIKSKRLRLEKVALMSLIVASYEDLLNEDPYEDSKDTLWKIIKVILESDFELFSELIDYWSLKKEKDEEDLFAITPYMREIIK